MALTNAELDRAFQTLPGTNHIDEMRALGRQFLGVAWEIRRLASRHPDGGAGHQLIAALNKTWRGCCYELGEAPVPVVRAPAGAEPPVFLEPPVSEPAPTGKKNPAKPKKKAAKKRAVRKKKASQ